MASPAFSGPSKSTASTPAETTGARKAAGPPPPPPRSVLPAPAANTTLPAAPAALEPKRALQRDGDEMLPPPDPSDLEPDLKTIPYVPGTGSALPSTIPPASPERSDQGRSALTDKVRRARSGFQRVYRAGSAFFGSRVGSHDGTERVSTRTLLGIALVVPCFGLGVVAVALASRPDASERRAARESLALKLEVNAAVPHASSSGFAAKSEASPASIEPQVSAPPPSKQIAGATDEASVLLSLADTLEAQARDEEAVAVLDRLLARRPDLRSDARVAKVLMETVYSDDRDASNAAFALLEGPMGEEGAALIYQLSRSRDVREGPRRRAETWLRSKAFDRVAALPLYTLVKLKLAKKCEEKRALLGLASAGGRETLDYLRELEARTTCAPDDLDNCYPCLRGDSRLGESIAILEKRLGR